MKKTILIILFACYGVFCQAQSWKTWSSGPLTWDDFQIVDPEFADTSATSYASFTLIRENKTVKTKGIAYKYQDVSAAINPAQSWVKAEGRNDLNLKKIQQEFDVLQHYATLYREDFMFYNDEKLNKYENYFPAESKHKLSETAYLEMFRSAVEKVHKTGDASKYPVSREPFDITHYPSKMDPGAMEAIILLTTIIPTGELSKMFSPAFGVTAGFGYREGKNTFRTDLTLGVIGPKPGKIYTQTMTGALIITEGSCLGLTAKYGRIVFASNSINLSLFAGAGYTSWKNGTLFSKPVISGLTLTEGICLDVHLHRTFNYLAKIPQAHDFGLQFRIYSDQLYHAAQKALIPTVNFSAGLCFGFRKLSKI